MKLLVFIAFIISWIFIFFLIFFGVRIVQCIIDNSNSIYYYMAALSFQVALMSLAKYIADENKE